MKQQKILLTGVAGFIGYHVGRRILNENPNIQIIGIDNLNPYYAVELKQARLRELQALPQAGNTENFQFFQIDLADGTAVANLFEQEKFDSVIHLAAQAGVRYSLQNPGAYIDSNITGFMNILEGCRHHPVQHLVYASSSSVYGRNQKLPFSTDDRVDHPVSLYAATKKSNEMMAECYAHLYKIPTTGLRFFTVYGPWGRPDLSYYKFTEAIYAGRPIDVYNFGDMRRDFTYIDDIVDGVIGILPHIPDAQRGLSVPHIIYNIGNHHPEKLLDMIDILEDIIGIKATRNLMPMQPGDVYATYADITPLQKLIGFTPKTRLKDGLAEFVKWYRHYHNHAPT